MLGVRSFFAPRCADVVDCVLDLAPAEETVCSFAAKRGERFWGVEEACSEGDGGGGTEGGEF
jgi:hypothetical protein